MKIAQYILLLVAVLSFSFTETSIAVCQNKDVSAIIEISQDDNTQVFLASILVNSETINDAEVWLNGMRFKNSLSIDLKPSRSYSFSNVSLNIPIYHLTTKDIDTSSLHISIKYNGKVHNFSNISVIVLPEEEIEEALEEEPTADPIDLSFEDIRVELGGGIKVIHAKIYDLTQMEYHGIVRVRGKTKKYNPLCLFGVGSIDYSGKVSAMVYYHSFKGNRRLETTVEVDGYAPLVFLHTGVRYRFAKYASTKVKRVLVNKSKVPLTNMQLKVDYQAQGKNQSYTFAIKEFKSLVLDLNTFYPMNPVLGRTTPPITEALPKQEIEIPEREEFPQITILNTTNEEVKDVKLQFLYTSGKGNQSKEILFDPLGEEEVNIE